MKWIYSRIKIGATPIIILAIITFLIVEFFKYANLVKISFFHNTKIDIFLNLALIILLCFANSYLVLWKRFQNFAKEFFIRIPALGPIILRILVPNEHLKLVEVQTYDGNWEYALLLRVWSEPLRDGEEAITWYRVHTTGLGPGKLFCRVAEKNILLIPAEKQRDAVVTVFSFGFISEEKK